MAWLSSSSVRAIRPKRGLLYNGNAQHIGADFCGTLSEPVAERADELNGFPASLSHEPALAAGGGCRAGSPEGQRR